MLFMGKLDHTWPLSNSSVVLCHVSLPEGIHRSSLANDIPIYSKYPPSLSNVAIGNPLDSLGFQDQNQLNNITCIFKLAMVDSQRLSKISIIYRYSTSIFLSWDVAPPQAFTVINHPHRKCHAQLNCIVMYHSICSNKVKIMYIAVICLINQYKSI